jgi:rhamnulose-1-phosphate aldolase
MNPGASPGPRFRSKLQGIYPEGLILIYMELKVNFDPSLNFWPGIFQKKEMKNIVLEFAEVAGYLWERRWAERNAGNISVNITSLFPDKELDRFSTYPFLPLPKAYPELTRQLLLITSTGSRMRDVAKNPLEELCLVYIGNSPSAYHIIVPDQAVKQLMPTSELPTHLAVHEMLLKMNAPEKALMHTHVTELIALTHDPRFHSNEALTNILWKMHPETVLLQPKGYGFVSHVIPGTEKIAVSTARSFKKHPVVVWEKHGALAIGRTLPEAFDELDLAAKAAGIYLSCIHEGFEPQGFTDEQIREIRNHQGL